MMSSYNSVTGSLLKFAQAEPWKQRLAEHMQGYIAFCAYYLKVSTKNLEARIESSDDAARMIFGVVFEDLMTVLFQQHTLVDAYMQKHGWKESANSKRYANFLAMSSPAIYLVTAVVPGKSISVQAVEGGEVSLIDETTASHHVIVNQCLYARVLTFNGRNVFTGGVLPFSVATAVDLSSVAANEISLELLFGLERPFSSSTPRLGMLAALFWLEDYFFDASTRDYQITHVQTGIDDDEQVSVVQAHLTAQYRKTLKTRIPMLGDKTPRMAMRSKAGKQQVIDWLTYLEDNTQMPDRDMPPYDFTWMWQELGLLAQRPSSNNQPLTANISNKPKTSRKSTPPIEQISAKSMLQFSVMLRDSNPAVWRRLQITADASFYEFHIALQSVMGWTDSHLHEFSLTPKGKRKALIIGLPDEEGLDDRPRLISWQTKLSDYCQTVGQKLEYLYDFGDSWQHDILLEGILLAQTKDKYPKCIDGAGACPPEDCGGIPGYRHLLEVINDPRHEDYAYLSKWLKSMGKKLPLDAQLFDCKEVKFINAKKSLKGWLEE